jgi:hypothetical protein
MHVIKLVTFKGCQSTMDFRDQLEVLIDQGAIDATVELVIVQSPLDAARFELHGSPTILIDGIEYQRERHGPTGFY